VRPVSTPSTAGIERHELCSGPGVGQCTALQVLPPPHPCTAIPDALIENVLVQVDSILPHRAVIAESTTMQTRRERGAWATERSACTARRERRRQAAGQRGGLP